MVESSPEQLKQILAATYQEIQKLRLDIAALRQYVALLEGVLRGKNPTEYETLPDTKRLH